MSDATPPPSSSATSPPSSEASTLGWLRAHPYLVGLSLSFMLACMVLSPVVFPGISLGLAIFGGAVFGMFCTLCATMHMFYE